MSGIDDISVPTQFHVFTLTQNCPSRIQSPHLSILLKDECQTDYTTQMHMLCKMKLDLSHRFVTAPGASHIAAVTNCHIIWCITSKQFRSCIVPQLIPYMAKEQYRCCGSETAKEVYFLLLYFSFFLFVLFSI